MRGPREPFGSSRNCPRGPSLRPVCNRDLFADVVDTKLRHGIGHHSAHHEVGRDEVVLYDTKQGATVERRIRYTDFCDRVLH